MIDQVVGSSGFAGDNYNESNEAESKKDFTRKAGIAKKELKEAKHRLRLPIRANPDFKDEFRKLWQENYELILIFSKIIKSCRNK